MHTCIIFKVKERKQSNVLCRRVYTIKNHAENYTGENSQCIENRVYNNNGRGQDSDLVKHAIESNPLQVVKNDFMLDKRCTSNTLKRKIAKALITKLLLFLLDFFKKNQLNLNFSDKASNLRRRTCSNSKLEEVY